ncbi:hypothetical protein LMG28688_01594 [Paraburkholderia caffeinitolerans]|uniref:Uncharacterized protein n=1 Tax=Paraburkholderia caffeinitolerans TaxID=1723730 RepID=A0A6J5FRG5_9BURK|nr:hypothetical protein [Paraburkholderia caffeinitolerans]CAB3783175.1 hypothetical protein LMG28688_01594 [Paraburkholderia caffeinitolerans]
MRAADVLRELGRPIAYYPFLSRYLGGVNASVLFCQIFYWQDKATSELGVHKTVEELEEETGLSYEEQRAARAKLRACGVLIETAKRIEHRTYFRIDEDALERLLESPAPERAPRKSPSPRVGKSHLPRWEKSISGDGKSPPHEMDKPELASEEKPMPRDGENHARGNGNSHPVNGTETTAEITSETTAAAAREGPSVDNSAAAAADEQKAGTTPLDAEAQLTDLLIGLEAERGKRLVVDRSRDRLHIVTWVGRAVTHAELREAHKCAVAARDRDDDSRALNVGFVARFVDEVLAARQREAGGASDSGPGNAAAPASDWWLSDSGTGAQGKRVRVDRRPNESTPEYLVRVAKASGRGPWIDHVLKSWQGSTRYQQIIDFLGAELLPSDFYA